MADSYQKQDIKFTTKNFKQEYELCDRTLGEGTSGTIYTCKSIKEDRMYALKCLEDDETSVAEILFLQKSTDKDHLISLRDVFYNKGMLEEHTANENYFYLVMEMMDGNLSDKISQELTEHTAAFLAREVALGLVQLHGLGIIHRDIKPDNVLFKNTELEESHPNLRVVLADFGLSVEERSKPKCPIYSEVYGAPEIIALDSELNPDLLYSSTGSPYDHRVDIWSFGVLVYVMLCRQAPFKSVAHILSGEIEFQEHISDEARNLISHILQPDPDKRPSLEDILRHPWLQVPQ
eukprot:TRINITY_DN1604_c0_g5_i1.p1 TRINITY_DN1604_c0_g5~~TRINITY_DN1604_c0_g5_i1.p1  ORF type:complete len:292 (+),score=52.31 TRINITY_DN1604_c0_g5_i1:727-1602(+)